MTLVSRFLHPVTRNFVPQTLLTWIGQDALDTCDGPAFDDDEQTEKDFGIVLRKLEEFCVLIKA